MTLVAPSTGGLVVQYEVGSYFRSPGARGADFSLAAAEPLGDAKSAVAYGIFALRRLPFPSLYGAHLLE